MSHVNVLARRAHDNAAVMVQILSKGVTLWVVHRSVDLVAKGHADQVKSQMIWECFANLDMHGRDKLYLNIWPKYMEREHILVLVGIVCLDQFVY